MNERARVLEIRNGEKAPPMFSATETERRLGGLRAHLAAADLDAALFTSIHNVAYYSGFVYCGFGRSYGLVVTADGSTLVTPVLDYGAPWRRAHGDTLAYTDWRRDNFHEALRRLLPARGRIGVEMDHLTVQAAERLRAALPGLALVDVSEAAMRQRMVKSPEEHDLIRAGAAVCDAGGAACVEAIGEGVPEHEIALHATATMVREIARRYPDAELRDTWTWLQSGINTDGAHNPVTTRRLERGDVLSLNCFAMIAGYYTALERTAFLGEVAPRARELWEINCEVHRRGIELIRPGARCRDIAEELNAIYARHGLLERRTFGYGHSFGVLCHYYGREAGLELREDVDTVLEPGMVVSMEPMITIPEGEPGAGGYREHDILIVTADGAEDITGFPFGPEHNVL